MSQKYSYLILGAGKQGVAAAYDVIRFGNAEKVTLADASFSFAKKAVERLKKLLGPTLRKNKTVLAAFQVNGKNPADLRKVIQGHDALLSALPYYLNANVARAAISAGVNYCDLGGYFDATREIMKLSDAAKRAGVSLITDCGVSPGMCNSLAACGIAEMDSVDAVRIYCGGLPQKPKPPLNYKIVFNLEGVIGNYFGKSYVLRNGAIKLDAAFSGKEVVDVGAPLGKLEAMVTGGATSTCPWTYKGKIRHYDYKTLRWPGHWDKIQTLKDLGLLETEKVQVNGSSVAPRDLFVAVAGPKLRFEGDRDLLILQVNVAGRKSGKPLQIIYRVLDYEDPKTGFTAMQRTTGFSAAIVLQMLARGLVTEKGFVPVEKAVPGRYFLDEVKKRGIQVKEIVKSVK